MTDADLDDRLRLIEGMILEARRTTQYWGWVFIMWGLGQLAAVSWGALWHGASWIPWAVTLAACGLIQAAAMTRASRRQEKETLADRAVGAVWIAFSLSFPAQMVILSLGRGASNGLVIGTIFVLLGVANFASGMILRWWSQRAIGLFWWAAAVAVAATAGAAQAAIYLGAVLVGQILFGSYLVLLEKRDAARARAS